MIPGKSILLSLLLCILSIGYTAAQSSPRFDVYLLLGQSNMAGRGPLTEISKAEFDARVYVFNRDSTWVPAKHPLHYDKPGVAAVGPGLAFGIEMAKAYPKVRIGLIPCAVGGTPIEHWIPGAYDASTKTHPYDDAVKRISLAMAQGGVVKGVIWHQGEANLGSEKVKVYLDQLKELIDRVRILAHNPKLPFVAGELGEFYKGHADFNANIQLLPKLVKGTAVVSAKGLTDKGDQVHFDAASASELGKRYAEQILLLQKQLK